MKIIHLPDTFFPFTTGGKEVFVLNLAQNLNNSGFENIVVIHRKKEDQKEGVYYYSGIKVIVLPGIKNAYINLYDLKTENIDIFEKILLQEAPDIVHFHDQINGASLSHLKLVKKHKIKTVLTYHSPGQSCSQRALLYKGNIQCDGKIIRKKCTKCLLQNAQIPKLFSNFFSNISLPIVLFRENKIAKLIFRRSLINAFARSFNEFTSLIDIIQIHAKWVEELLLNNGISKNKIIFKRMGSPFANSNIENKSLHKDQLNIYFSGRCNYVKGINTLIEGIKLIPSKYNIKIHILGPYWDENGYPSTQYNKIKNDCRWEKPRLLAPNEIRNFMKKMDICIIPSIWKETGPIVALEALSMNIPVIGSRLGGIEELVIDGKNGLLFEPGNHVDLSKKITYLLDNPQVFKQLSSNNAGRPISMSEFNKSIGELYYSLK